jgi:hypothetical protein
MGKPRHYLKILPNLEHYAKAILSSPEDWQQNLFDDLTEKGTKITYERLDFSEGRPRIGLCGDTYYCEAGKDTDREGDGLFVYRVENAFRRIPSHPPERYEASFHLLV